LLRERNQVRRTCLDTLKLYRDVAAEMPEANSHERNKQVVARRTGADPAGVARIPETRQGEFRVVAERSARSNFAMSHSILPSLSNWDCRRGRRWAAYSR